MMPWWAGLKLRLERLRGYAYVSQNKGVLNFFVASFNSPTPPEPLACRLNPASTVWVHFYDNDPATPFTRWTPSMIEATRIGGNALSAALRQTPAADLRCRNVQRWLSSAARGSKPRQNSTTAASTGRRCRGQGSTIPDFRRDGHIVRD